MRIKLDNTIDYYSCTVLLQLKKKNPLVVTQLQFRIDLIYY